MSSVAGEISIDIFMPENRQHDIRVFSSRPVLASKIMTGKSPEQALSLIPLLFNICGIAQGRAALLAIGQINGQEKNSAIEIARDMLLLIENMRESLFQIFVVWPKLFQLESQTFPLNYLAKMIPEFKNKLFKHGNAFTLNSELSIDDDFLTTEINNIKLLLNQHLFHTEPQQWLAMDSVEGLMDWSEQQGLASSCLAQIFKQNWSDQGKTQLDPLPVLETKDLIHRLDAKDADSFIQQPDWQGNYYECTSLSRQQFQPLVQDFINKFDKALASRFVARLVELAKIPHQLESLQQKLLAETIIKNKACKEFSDNEQDAVAQIDVTRGRLIHRVKIANKKIAQYQIIAPTEWNFHPQGLIKQALANIKLEDKQQVEKLSHLLITMIDPCVNYQLRIH